MPISPDIAQRRARIAGMTHGVYSGSRAADDPELAAAKRDLRAEKLAAHVAAEVAKAPPLLPAQINRISALLRTAGTNGGSAE